VKREDAPAGMCWHSAHTVLWCLSRAGRRATGGQELGRRKGASLSLCPLKREQ